MMACQDDLMKQEQLASLVKQNYQLKLVTAMVSKRDR